MKKSLINFPKISIITPSLNQGKYIEKTITSVLNQNYPNLEYIVMDGGSNDETLSILNKYSKKLTFFSKKDKGQSHAINKGLEYASGDIVCYLNSDDYLLPGSLSHISKFFSDNPKAFWVTGKCIIVNEKNKEVRNIITIYKNIFLKYFCFKSVFNIVQFISQPSTFWRIELINKIGLFDEKLNYDMDYDYWLRIWQRYKLFYIDRNLSAYRVHEKAKALISPETQFAVQYQILKKYQKNKILRYIAFLHIRLSLIAYRLFFTK